MAGLVVVPAVAWRCRPARGSPSARRRPRPAGARTIVRSSRQRTSMTLRRCDSKSATAAGRRSTPSASRLRRPAPRADGGSRSCDANGSPGATSPSNVRKVGRTASLQPAVGDHHVEDRLRASPTTASHTPMVSNSRRAAAAIAEARASRRLPGQRRIGDRDRERTSRAPGARRSPARARRSPPPAISTSMGRDA